MRLAAIDIGSNGVRLLIADVEGDENGQITRFRKVKLFRVPVRLGLDAFTQQAISEASLTRFAKAMKGFVYLMEVYEVEDFRACATSAMRESDNAEQVIEHIRDESGITIQIIDGQSEADLILSNKALLTQVLDPRFSHLYVDVGGGSTELSLLKEDEIVLSRSFKIGTIRLLQNMAKEKDWNEMADWMQKEIAPKNPLNIIGSGGNINRIFKRSGNRHFEPLMYDFIRKERDLIATLDIEDRIYLQDLNRDRAEVIVPALDIFLFVMNQTGIRQVVVPKIGVADGIVRRLFEEKMRG